MRIISIILTLTILMSGVLSCAEPIAEEPVQYTLTISSSDGGSVTTPGEDTFAYDEGTVVDLVATADSGYYFVEWTGDVDTVASVTAAATAITMSGDHSIAASFLEIPSTQYNLSISSTTGGSVTSPGEGNFTYDDGTLVSLVASPASGYRFVEWTGDVDTVADIDAASTTITMNGDCSITANFAEPYATSDTLLVGLSFPTIHARDEQGRIYFVEFDPILNQHKINRFDPVTEQVVKLIEHQGAAVYFLSLDGQGNLYYTLVHDDVPSVVDIRRLRHEQTTSEIILSIVESDQWLIAFTVDWSGNVYFCLQSGQRPHSLLGSELRRIPAGTTTTETLAVLDDSLMISCVGTADEPDVVYFISHAQDVDRIHRFDLGTMVLDTLLERAGWTDNYGRIVYLATKTDGDLYYLYRQRSEADATDQSGYLEIGRFTAQDMKTGQPPKLLVADMLDLGVWVLPQWSGLNHFAISDVGDVFFTIILHQGGPVEQSAVGIFWLDPLTRTYVSLVESTGEEVRTFTFALDSEMNVFYAGYGTDRIVRINR